MGIRTVQLINFRNHSALELETKGKIINIVGNNGSGKTNVLEALSLLAPGKGMKGGSLDGIAMSTKSEHGWGVIANVETLDDENRIVTNYINGKRTYKLNETVLKQSSAILEHLRVIWLMPSLDPVLGASASVKLRFMDRICYNFFPSHAASINKYENATRQRNRLLQDYGADDIWLSSLESIMAEEAVKIYAIRMKSLEIIGEGLKSFTTAFTQPKLSIEGKLEDLVASTGSTAPVSEIQEAFKKFRVLDARSKRCNFGAHRSELVARHGDKGCSANICSTGELKAMLISVVLAQCYSIKKIFNGCVVILLDDIFSHLDQNMRQCLFEEIIKLDLQAWVSSTDEVAALSKYENYVKISL